MLKVKNLSGGYGGNDIIRGVSFEALPGELLAVVGPNGSGKSTLLKTLGRLLPYRGGISLEGEEISALPRKHLARKIALLAQTSGICFPYTVYDTASLGRYPHGRSFLKDLSGEDAEIIETVLERLGLADIRNRLINELSGGQLQRVFLARTLIQNPALILLDEPTNHLDLKHQVELLEYLARWVKDGRRAVIAVLHDLNLALRFADKAALIREGRLVSFGACGKVLSDKALEESFGMNIRAFMLESLEKWRGEATAP